MAHQRLRVSSQASTSAFSLAVHSRPSTSLQLRRNHFSVLAVIGKALGVEGGCQRRNHLAGAGVFALLGGRGAVAGRATPVLAVLAGKELLTARGLRGGGGLCRQGGKLFGWRYGVS
jgi:hypothetical protein